MLARATVCDYGFIRARLVFAVITKIRSFVGRRYVMRITGRLCDIIVLL